MTKIQIILLSIILGLSLTSQKTLINREDVNICTDNPVNWYDSDGPCYDCQWYAKGYNCYWYGNGYANNGQTANQACCACGGGITVQIPDLPDSKQPRRQLGANSKTSPVCSRFAPDIDGGIPQCPPWIDEVEYKEYIIVEMTSRPCDCISHKMRVFHKEKGLIQIDQLKVGDYIKGIKGLEKQETYCKVTNIDYHGEAAVHSNLTSNHLVYHHSNNTVESAGITPESRGDVEDVYNVRTDCEAFVSEENQYVTPYISQFCRQPLKWDEYWYLFQSITNVFMDTMNVPWFNSTRMYLDAPNGTWLQRLPEICTSMKLCLYSGNCEVFEAKMDQFVQENINHQDREEIQKVFPSASEMKKVFVFPGTSQLGTILIFVAIGVGTFLLGGGVAFLYYRKKKKENAKTIEVHDKEQGFQSAPQDNPETNNDLKSNEIKSSELQSVQI